MSAGRRPMLDAGGAGGAGLPLARLMRDQRHERLLRRGLDLRLPPVVRRQGSGSYLSIDEPRRHPAQSVAPCQAPIRQPDPGLGTCLLERVADIAGIRVARPTGELLSATAENGFWHTFRAGVQSVTSFVIINGRNTPQSLVFPPCSGCSRWHAVTLRCASTESVSEPHFTRCRHNGCPRFQPLRDSTTPPRRGRSSRTHVDLPLLGIRLRSLDDPLATDNDAPRRRHRPIAIYGFYCMTFEHMPELGRALGYPSVVTFIAVTCTLVAAAPGGPPQQVVAVASGWRKDQRS
jgi:hypothetical protein